MPILDMNCLLCGKTFKGGIFKCRTTKYCSRSCMSKSYKKERASQICITCKKEYKPQSDASKYCSTKCIRYTGPKEKLSTNKGGGFWENATDKQKIERVIEDFNRLVIKRDGCWGWSLCTDANGYTKINTGRSSMLGHRVSWIIHNGPIDDNKWILHRCDNPTCTNPEHLFIGTPKDNSEDCSNKKRKNASFGNNHYNSKLSDESVKEIRELLKDGFSQNKLGKMFNVSASSIQKIHENKIWKHVKD